MTPEQRRVYDSIVGGIRGELVGPLRAALHSPELAEAWSRLGAILRFGTSLPPRVSELAIIVTARRWNSQVEWLIHSESARKAGVSESAIEAIKDARAPVFDDPELADVYEYVRQMQHSGDVSDELYGRIVARWQAVGVVELTALVGYYTMVSMTLNAHGIPVPGDTPPPLRSVGAAGGLTDMEPAQASQPASANRQAH
jgi:4-carboxymuconolactone decarboxylase